MCEWREVERGGEARSLGTQYCDFGPRPVIPSACHRTKQSWFVPNNKYSQISSLPPPHTTSDQAWLLHRSHSNKSIRRDLSDLWWPVKVCQIYLLKQAWNNLHDGSKIFLVKVNIFHGIKIYLAYLNGWIWFIVNSKHNKSIIKEST